MFWGIEEIYKPGVRPLDWSCIWCVYYAHILYTIRLCGSVKRVISSLMGGDPEQYFRQQSRDLWVPSPCTCPLTAGSSFSAHCYIRENKVHLHWPVFICWLEVINVFFWSHREPGILQPNGIHRLPQHSRHPDTGRVRLVRTTASALLPAWAG